MSDLQMPKDSPLISCPKSSTRIRGLSRFISSSVSASIPPVPHAGRKFGDVVDQVLMELAGVLAVQGPECEAAQVVNLDVPADSVEQDHVASRIVHALGQALRGLQNRRLRGLQDAVEPPHHDE